MMFVDLLEEPQRTLHSFVVKIHRKCKYGVLMYILKFALFKLLRIGYRSLDVQVRFVPPFQQPCINIRLYNNLLLPAFSSSLLLIANSLLQQS
jgi:hypothetical protein